MSDFKAKMYQIQSWLTAYSAPPDPLAGLRGPTSKGWEGTGRGGEGGGGKRGHGEGRVREPRGGEGTDPTHSRPP